jgi:hypothetical protein
MAQVAQHAVAALRAGLRLIKALHRVREGDGRPAHAIRVRHVETGGQRHPQPGSSESASDQTARYRETARI